MQRLSIQDAKYLAENICQCWNNGDLQLMCHLYSEQASLVTCEKHIVGKENILEYYEDTFPNLDAMGTLSLEVLEYREFNYSPKDGLGIGQALFKWTLTPAETVALSNARNGHSLVVFKKSIEGIFIITDASF